MRGARIGFALAVAVVALARTASASFVRVDGCEGIDGAEVARLFDVELATVAGARHPLPLEVTLACAAAGEGGDGEVTVRIADPRTGKASTRTVAFPEDEGVRAQLLAFAISELFVTSWREVVVTAADAGRGAAAPADPPRVPDVAPAPTAAPGSSAPSSSWTMAVGGAAFRDAAAIVEIGPEIVVARGVGPVRAMGVAGVSYGARAVPMGEVAVTAGHLGVGVGCAWPLGTTWAFEGAATVALFALRAEGRTSSPQVASHDAVGAGVEAALAAGPTLRSGPATFGASVMGRLRAPRMTGVVLGGDPLRLDGAALGAAVWVRLAIAD